MRARVIGRVLFVGAAVSLLVAASLSWTEPRLELVRDEARPQQSLPTGGGTLPDVRPQQLMLLLGVMQQRGS